MTSPKRIGVLTGGGDVPGLNSVIKSVTYRASELGIEVIGIRRGWEGLTHVAPGGELDPEYLRQLDRRNTRTIDRTLLGSARGMAMSTSSGRYFLRICGTSRRVPSTGTP